MCHSILYLPINCFIESSISGMSKVNLFPSHCIVLGKCSVDFFYLFLGEMKVCHDVDVGYPKCAVIFTFIFISAFYFNITTVSSNLSLNQMNCFKWRCIRSIMCSEFRTDLC